jgi:hypothetical protein
MRWTSDKKDELRTLRQNKKSLQEIGDIYGVSRERVRQLIGNTGYINNVIYPDGYRRCYRCKKTLKDSDFYEGKSVKNFCKGCLLLNSRKWTKIYSYKFRKGGVYYEKSKARIYLNMAVKSGKVIKGGCIIGVGCHGRIEGHHYKGYDKKNQFDVQWLCSKHHHLADKKGSFEPKSLKTLDTV